MSLFQFYAHNSREAATLIGQHLFLVAVSTGIALTVGVPGGILLTRRPAWRGPVLGLANVLQTIPSLALFGFLIPLPFIGGIGARTAIVPLVVYALLPIVRNTYTGIAGVDRAVRDTPPPPAPVPRFSPGTSPPPRRRCASRLRGRGR